MDLTTIYTEILALRKDVQRYHSQTITNHTDIAWLKRVVIGGFSFVFTIIGGVILATIA